MDSGDIPGFLDHASPETSADPALDFTVTEASLNQEPTGIQSLQLRRLWGPLNWNGKDWLPSVCVISILQVTVSLFVT